MLEKTIISNLIHNEDFFRTTIPYLKEEYFEDPVVKKIFSSFKSYVVDYNSRPSKEALEILIDSRNDLNEQIFKDINKYIRDLEIDAKTNQEWLLKETEKYCQDRDLYNSIRRAILILDGQDKQLDKGSIPQLLSDSLSISFDTNIGHDFLEDSNERFDFYHKKEERISLDIDLLNKITNGGLPKKSMSIILGSTGGGKSLVKCHIAANTLMQGKNVLYITLEMAEERIAQRIDANLLDVTLDELVSMPRSTYEKRIKNLKEKTLGKLLIKEYPTGSAHAGNFRYLLNELKLKKNFVPELICIDYLNICASSRIKGGSNANSYTLIKSIAEELRGLAMEFNCCLLTSSQYNRTGYDSSDIDLTATSDSMGTTFTGDLILALISNEELESMSQIIIKQLKNRFGDMSYYRRFLVGIDRSKMKLYNLDISAQKSVTSEPKLEAPTLSKSRKKIVEGLQ
jgi:archaellum biogenesis ATPase FlaH